MSETSEAVKDEDQTPLTNDDIVNKLQQMVDDFHAKKMAGKKPEIICIYHAGEGSDDVEVCSSASEEFRSI